MSEQESSSCGICGGWKRIAYTIEFRECVPHSISVDPNTVIAPFKLCPGHREPAQKQDYGGKLDEQGDYTASLWSNGVDIDRPSQHVELSPAQALSLLAWLEQNREKLQQMAKEQG